MLSRHFKHNQTDTWQNTLSSGFFHPIRMRALFCPFRILWAWDTDAGFLQGWEKIITSHGASPDITWNSSRFLCVSRRGFPVRVIDRQVHHGGFEDGMDLAIPPIRIRNMISLNYPENQSIPLVVGLHFSSTSYIMPCRFANIKQVIWTALNTITRAWYA